MPADDTVRDQLIKEALAIDMDLAIYGAAFIVEGRRVDPRTVVICGTPDPYRYRKLSVQAILQAFELYGHENLPIIYAGLDYD